VQTEQLTTENEVEEYKALRATIRERGSVRTCVFVAGIAAWALVALAATFVAIPLMAVLPLILLAGTFEAVFALHVGVERIGRYLQVFYDDRWEQTAMAFGPPLAGTGSDPLFAWFFALATVGNLAPVLAAAPVGVELAVVGGAHALFLVRLIVARRVASRQRAADLDRFQQIKSGPGSERL
jgi:hypothetical protein